MKRCASLKDIAQEKQFVAALPTLLEMGFLWEMGFVLIRHSAVDLRRANMDRVPKVLCVRLSERSVRWVRENLCLWLVSKAAMNETWQVDDNCFRTQRCAILILPALEPRVFAWWNVIILFSMCCDTLCASVHAVWVGVLFTLQRVASVLQSACGLTLTTDCQVDLRVAARREFVWTVLLGTTTSVDTKWKI